MVNLRTLAVGAALSLSLLGAACGHTTEQRAASGALIGAAAGGAVTGRVGGAVAGGVVGAVAGAATTEHRCVERYRDGRCARWSDG